MKKLFHICALAAIAASALSCSKETADKPAMKTISVELGAPAVEATRTAIVDGSHVYWTAADVNILCFTTDCVTNGAAYGLVSSDKTQTARKIFTGEIPEGLEPRFFYYDRNRVAGSKQVQLKEVKQAGVTTGYYLRQLLPNNQQRLAGDNAGNYLAETFHTGLNHAIAKPGDTSFKNVLGYFKWTNNGSLIKYIKLETVGSEEYFSGYFDVYYDDAEPVTIPAPGVTHYTSVESGVADGKTIHPDANHYAIVIPGTFHGLKITIYLAAGGSFAIKSDKTFTVERGKYVDLGVLPAAAITKAGAGLLPGSGDFAEGWMLE